MMATFKGRIARDLGGIPPHADRDGGDMIQTNFTMGPRKAIGHYLITAKLGEGGMGEVWRATDTKLNREVAVKVLPAAFANDAARMQRFEREAQVLASLNHPNIAAIYGVEEQALVMELVEGATLADRIAQRPMPIEEALPLLNQLIEALECAHERGIVHRDLKPANIKVRPDAVLKVLDFGLAKVAEAAIPVGSLQESPTETAGVSLAGQIVGTPAYMAPEQVRGRVVDKRVDIWAFGVIFYELVTGRRLFSRQTNTDTFTAVLTFEPAWNDVPRRFRRLLRRCLEKEPKRRLRDIADAWALLDNDTDSPKSKSPVAWKAVTAILAIILCVFSWTLLRSLRRPSLPRQAVTLDLNLGHTLAFSSSIGPAAIISPDGTRTVFVSDDGGKKTRLFTKRFDERNAIPLEGTDGAYQPFFSPDGQWVGFFAEGKLKKVRIDGAETVSLCDSHAARGASWGDDGIIVAALDQEGGLSQIPADGGTPLPVTELRRDMGEFSHRWPQVLPGGKAVLFTAATRYNYDDAAIAAVSLDGKRITTLIEHGGLFPRYLPSGHLIYAKNGGLLAAAFDVDRLQVVGPSVKLPEQPATRLSLGFAHLDFSRTGALLYFPRHSEGLMEIDWLDGLGNINSAGVAADHYECARLSPDSNRFATVVTERATSSIWIYDRERGSKWSVSGGLNADGCPLWSPDGRFVVFASAGGMFWVRSDGSVAPQPLVRSKRLELPSSFTQDGALMAYAELVPGAGAEIRTVPVEATGGLLRAGAPETFLKTPTATSFPAFSPDGRWVAYASPEQGLYQVYVRSFPDRGTQWQISNSGGVLPVWSPNGRELFYRTENQQIMMVRYTAAPNGFTAQKPQVWSVKRLATVGLTQNFDLAPEGSRVLALLPVKASAPAEEKEHVILELNFFDEVRDRASDRKIPRP